MDCSTLKSGDICLTISGREREFIGYSSFLKRYIFANSPEAAPIALIYTKDGEHIHPSFGIGGTDGTDNILRKKPLILEGWINIHENEGRFYTYTVWKKKEDAEACDNRIKSTAIVHIRQEYEAGDGL